MVYGPPLSVKFSLFEDALARLLSHKGDWSWFWKSLMLAKAGIECTWSFMAMKCRVSLRVYGARAVNLSSAEVEVYVHSS